MPSIGSIQHVENCLSVIAVLMGRGAIIRQQSRNSGPIPAILNYSYRTAFDQLIDWTYPYFIGWWGNPSTQDPFENTNCAGSWPVCMHRLAGLHGIYITSDHGRYVLAAVHERIAEPNRK